MASHSGFDPVHPGAIQQAGGDAEGRHQSDVGGRLGAADDGRHHQHALQAQFRVGHQVGQQRAGVHAQIQEHARHRHFHQRREVHEHAEDHRHGVALQVVLAGQGLDPFGLDQLADHADDKDADHQQQEDLLHEAPRFPQPGLPVVWHSAVGHSAARPTASARRRTRGR